RNTAMAMGMAPSANFAQPRSRGGNSVNQQSNGPKNNSAALVHERSPKNLPLTSRANKPTTPIPSKPAVSAGPANRNDAASAPAARLVQVSIGVHDSGAT